MKSANLDVLPEILERLLMILVTRPLGPVHHHLPRHVQRIERVLRQSLNLFNILVLYPPTFPPVVHSVPNDRRCSREENEPVP